jgi:hypothetical protein
VRADVPVSPSSTENLSTVSLGSAIAYNVQIEEFDELEDGTEAYILTSSNPPCRDGTSRLGAPNFIARHIPTGALPSMPLAPLLQSCAEGPDSYFLLSVDAPVGGSKMLLKVRSGLQNRK